MGADPSIMRGTGQGLLEFCDRLANRGDIEPDRAKAYRTSAKKILEVESDNLDDINLRELDVDDLFARFAKLNKAVYSDGSLKTYRSRFRLVVHMYLAWLDDYQVGRLEVVRHPRPQTAPSARLVGPRAPARQDLLPRNPNCLRTRTTRSLGKNHFRWSHPRGRRLSATTCRFVMISSSG